jgi:hypothetical protein
MATARSFEKVNRHDRTSFKSVNKSNPCLICSGDHKCSRGADGLICCGRVSGEVHGFIYLGQAARDEQFALYRMEGDPILIASPSTHSKDFSNGHHFTTPKTNPLSWESKAKNYVRNLTPEFRRELAGALGLPEDCLETLGIGFNPNDFHAPCWTFPEVDASVRVVGITRRFRNGEKKAEPGGNRGLFLPTGWKQRDGPVYCPEGPTDTLSVTAMGCSAVGRPSNLAGIENLAELFKELPSTRSIVILGEWDPKENGTWPGRDGAVKVAFELSQKLGRLVHWALPPKGSKDVREWILAQKLGLDCADAWADLGEKFLAGLKLQEVKGQEIAGQKKVKTSNEAKPVPVLISLADIEPKPVEWVWQNWIPRRAITILDGDPGLGKSTLAVDISARITRGWKMPAESGEDPKAKPGCVLLLSAEDDAETTIRPRLDAAGCEVSKVFLFEAVKTGEEESPPVLPWDLALVEETIVERGILLVVIDPLTAFLSNEIDAHKDQDVRRCLHRLKLIAQRTGVAILVIRHLNKLTGGPSLYRGGGSIGIVGAARSALIVGCDPDNPETKVLACNKSNLGASPKSLSYTLKSVSKNVAKIGWGGEVNLGSNEILAHPQGRQKMTMGEQCAEMVKELLAIGDTESDELEGRCKKMGFSERSIKEARKELKVKAYKNQFSGKWIVSLPKGNTQGEQAV